MRLAIPCTHYQQGNCQSCQWIELSYPQQLQQKTHHLKTLLATLDQTQLQWFEPFPSQSNAFRNKAKMAVSGSVERPIFGILSNPDDPQSAVDLTDCLLYPTHFQQIFAVLKDFIARAGLVPYNIKKRKGELKYILLTESQMNGELMLRFVVRSMTKLALVQRELPRLLTKLANLKVISLNIQPQHAAILEGKEEIFLTPAQTLTETFNQIPLFIRPQSFFQTNPNVASALYHTAQQWVRNLPVQHLWDLFCGVGGFGLHCAQALQQKNPNCPPVLTGIEISPSAIHCATQSAQMLGLKNVQFCSLDSAHFTLNQQQKKPDLVIVNPPRRGIGKQLAEFLNTSRPPFILYSSCNASTMSKDLQHLGNYQMQKIQLFDMFPHSSHYEVLTLLKLKSGYVYK